MKQLTHHLLWGLLIGMLLAWPVLADANDRQRCLNDCVQAGATQQQQCQADYAREMIRCDQLGTNEERKQCKQQANATLKSCNEAARQQVKVCKAGCPPK